MLILHLVLFWLILVFLGLFYFLSRILIRCAETFPDTVLVDFGFFGLVVGLTHTIVRLETRIRRKDGTENFGGFVFVLDLV